MLTSLKHFISLLKRHRMQKKLFRQLDIGSGTRVSLSNLDSMFPHLIHIGKDCIFAPGSMILTHDASRYLVDGTYYIAPVFISDRCFIGYNAVIKPGVKIGKGAIVGACSLVTKDVPAGSVVYGIPAKILCSVEEFHTHANDHVFTPPFAGKKPSEICQRDILSFQQHVYEILADKDPRPTEEAAGTGNLPVL